MCRRWVAAVAVAMLALAGCGGSEDSSGDAAGAPSEVAAVPSAGGDDGSADATQADAGTEAADGAVTVAVAGSDLGDILVDGEGMTLYVFDDDTGDTSTCYDDCATNWPPLTGTATAGEGADDSLLGTTPRDDGTMQVTYAGRPVYFFAGDQASGDTTGQGVGDKWWVVSPDGEAITDPAAEGDDAASGDDGSAAAAGDDGAAAGY